MDHDTARLALFVLSALSAIPAWRLCTRTVWYANKWWPIAVLGIALVTGLLAYGFFHLPFYLATEKTIEPLQIIMDLLTFSVVPLGVIALLGWTADHLAAQDKVLPSLIAAAACLAILSLPILYFVLGEQTLADYAIVVEELPKP